jgi:hypothetical protein
MAKTDLTGLLTGVTQAPIDPMLGASYEQRMLARGAQAAQGLRRGMGALTGADTRTTSEKAQAMLAQLDPTKKEDRVKILEVVSRVNPERAPALRAAFAEKDKEDALLSASVSSSTETRKSIAKQLEATHPDLAKAVIAERASGNTQALQAALDIIKEKSKAPSGEADPSLVKEYQFAKSTGYEGTFQEYIQSKKSPLVSTVETPQQKKLESNLERQEAMYDLTREAAPANITKAQTARKVLKTVNDGIATGAFPEFVANQSSAFQGVLQKFGIPVPEGLASNVLQQSELKKIQVDGMLPFIAEQGRGWTDADRENYFKTSAGFTQPWQYNEVVALTDLQNAVDGLDKNQFAYARAKLDTVTDLDGDTLYADYLKHLPRTKVIKDFKRGDLTYDKLEVIEDGANLSQYWVESIPKGFMIEKPNGEPVNMSWEDINATAQGRGQTAREFLAEQELKGSIKKAL